MKCNINILIGKEEEKIHMSKKKLKELKKTFKRIKPTLDRLSKKETTTEDIENFINLIEKNYKKKVQDALNKFFQHTMIYKGIIQIYPNATYHIEGKDILQLYKELEIENKAR